jgi:hypothetical protein
MMSAEDVIPETIPAAVAAALVVVAALVVAEAPVIEGNPL